MVALRCVEIGQAYRSIDVRVYVMIAGVIPLGIAMEQSGTARLLADGLLPLVHDWPTLPILLVMFTAAALMTQVLSESAPQVLLGPTPVALAASLGLPAILLVAWHDPGAAVAFLTPIGHHATLPTLGHRPAR